MPWNLVEILWKHGEGIMGTSTLGYQYPVIVSPTAGVLWFIILVLLNFRVRYVFSILLLILIWLLPARGNMICKQREQSQLLKFIASLLVVIGHQASFYNIHDEIFMRETALGALCVSFFCLCLGMDCCVDF